MSSPAPTYGELIDMMETAENLATTSGDSVAELLCSFFHKNYPHIFIGRASRFYDTVKRIAAPTHSSRLNQLNGSPLRSYLRRVWAPRIRNEGIYCIKINLWTLCVVFSYIGCAPTFPAELEEYGLTEKVLKAALFQCSESCASPIDLSWSLKRTPTIGFYRELHLFLRKWHVAHAVTKSTIGRFYISIDQNIRQKHTSNRPDNVYQFIERVVCSKKPSSAVMFYGEHEQLKCLKREVAVCSSEIHDLSSKVAAQQKELADMKREVEVAKKEVFDTDCVLKDITHRLQIAQKQRDAALSKVKKGLKKLLMILLTVKKSLWRKMMNLQN